jgi:hypothetical protein
MDMAEHTVHYDKDDDCAFVVDVKHNANPEKKKTYTLRAKTPQECKEWVTLLQAGKSTTEDDVIIFFLASIGKMITMSGPRGFVFGNPIDKLKLGDDGIPIVISEIIAFLTKHALSSEGIFRLSGLADRVQEIKTQLDKGESLHAGPEDIHAVAGVLKAMFREMPEPLFSYELYQPLLNARGNYRDAIGDQCQHCSSRYRLLQC